MNDKQNIQQAIRKLVTTDAGDEALLEAQVLLHQFCSRHSDEVQPLLGFALTGWRTEHSKVRKLESALEETAGELAKIRDGGRVGAVYVGDCGTPGSSNGDQTNVRSIMVACRGSLLEVPLSKELHAVNLIPGHSMVFLDQQCRYVTAVGQHSESSSFGRIGTVVRVVDDQRACVRFDEGRGEALVSIGKQVDHGKLKPDETTVRVIEATNNFSIAVEILPETEADEMFADGLDNMPHYSRDNVIGQDEAWEELDKLLLRELRNPRGRELYNLNGRNGALAPNRGVFIAGPTGVGKSMLVAAALHEMEKLAGRKLLVKYITGASFSSKWFGESEHRALSLYRRMSSLARPKEYLPVVVIDEAGPAFVRRSAAAAESGGTQAHSDLTNTFLHILGTTDVITIAIDNNPSAIDPAILRPGRLPLVRARRPGYRQCVEIARRNLETSLLAAGDTPLSLATTLCDFIFLAEEFQDILKVKFVGGTQRAYAGRDMVTGADLVEGIITPAAEAALRRDEAAGAIEEKDFSGISWNDVRDACLKRFNTIISNIDKYDAGDYLDIPEGKIIQSVEKKPLKL
jgi:SpoVK/Ycf46/Vps4 family AAA+-type ATPase